MVVVEEAELTINVLRGQFAPAVSTPVSASPDDMPNSLIDKMGESTERRRSVSKPEVSHPPAQVAIKILHLLLHPQWDRVMHMLSYRRPKPLLTSWTWTDKDQPSTCLPASDI